MPQKIAINKHSLKQILFVCITAIICIATLGLGLGLGIKTNGNDIPAEALQNENRVLPNGMTQVSAGGGGHTMAIDASGNLWAWGYNYYGQLGNMSTGTTINSTPFNITAQPSNPLYGVQIVQVSAGEYHTMAIDARGNLWAWGYNYDGQLGDAEGYSYNGIPVNITGQWSNPLYGKQFVQVSAGAYHTVAIDAQGNLWAFGYNYNGQLGDVEGFATGLPINITEQWNNPLYDKQIVQISTGGNHTMAIDSQGNLWAFGDNNYGQLGDIDWYYYYGYPVNITEQWNNPLNGKQIVQISAGENHTMAIDSQGNLWAFGDNEYGQLGNTGYSYNGLPENITEQWNNPLYGKQIVYISANGSYTMAIDSTGNLWAFGHDVYGQLGNMSTGNIYSTPINITGQGGNTLYGMQIMQVSAGYSHTMAIDVQGNLWAWGYNYYGQLGNMSTSGNNANSTPISITAQLGNPLNNIKFGRMQISAGTNHTMVIDASGNLWAFGINDRGQLGNMTSNSSIGNNTPFNITAQPGNPLENKKIVQVATGGGFTMAIDSTGNLWAFGYNANGQLGNMSSGASINSIPFNITAQSGNPLYGKQIIQVSVDNAHTMAIDSTGNLWAWGYNGDGQLGDLSTTSRSTPINITDQSGSPLYGKQIVQVSTGSSHSLAIDSQGNLWAFGYNYYGQLGDMTKISNRTPKNITAQSGNSLNGRQIVQVSAGQNHSVVIDSTGNLWTFGRNNYGQLGDTLTYDSSIPIRITAHYDNPLYDKQIVQVSTGTGEYTMAIDSTGDLWAFGSGSGGRLGNMSTTSINSTPINITTQPGNSLNGRQIIQVSAGRDHTMALDSTGGIWAFGFGDFGQLGSVSNSNSSTPIKIIIPPTHIGIYATVSGSTGARISVRTNFTTGWGTTTASGGTYTDWTPSILRAPGVIKNASTQEGRIRYEFDANGINTISAMTINGISITLTGYSSLTKWNNILYLRIIQTDNNRRLIVEMDRIEQPAIIAVTTTNNARVAAIMLGPSSARLSVRTNFTTGWGELTASGGTYTEWIANSPLASPDIKRNDSTEAGRVRYEFYTNGINTIDTMTINGTGITLTGYPSFDIWENLLYLRILSADSGRRLIVEMDRINTDQQVAIAVTTTNIARATATITGSPNARISVRTNFTTGWGTTTASGGTYTGWTADALTSPDVNRVDSTQTGRIRYEFDAVGINKISTLTINGIQIDLASYSNLTLWESILYLRIISADSGRRLIVEMDRISAEQLITLAVTTTRDVQHSFNFSNNSHISSRMSVDFGAGTKSLINTYSPVWTGNTGTINLAVFTFTSQSSFAKITISRPNLSDITITNFTGFLTTIAPTSGLGGSISYTTGATNILTINLTGMQEYEYTWTIETHELIQVQQILNPPAGATSVANPALLTLNSSVGAGWASAAVASPGNLFGKTFQGWYTHPTNGSKISTIEQLQQQINSVGGAVVFLYAHWA